MMGPAQIGKWIAVCIVLLPATYFFLRGLGSKKASIRWANLSLAFGLLALCPVEFALGLTPRDDPSAYRYSGIGRIILGLLGVVLGIIALVTRLKDKGSGIVRPIVGSVLSAFHVLSGAALILFAFMATSLTGPKGIADQWTYRSSKYNFSVTLPSSDWKENNASENGEVGFHYDGIHKMGAFVRVIQEDRKAFEKSVKNFRETTIKGNSALSTIQDTEGESSSGNPFHYFVGLEKTEKGNGIFVAATRTWSKEKHMTIIVLFEGTQKMTSAAGKSTEMTLFEESAKIICLSAE